MKHGSLWCLVGTAFVFGQWFALFALEVLPTNFELVLVLVIALRVASVIDAQKAPTNFCTTEIVHGQIGALLVFVFEPPKSLRLACFLIAYKLQKYGLAKLRENCDYVAFGELVRQAAEINVRRVAVVGMPRGFW